MDHVPEFWKDLKLEFKDNVKKKELSKSLIEEEKVDEHNIIRTKSEITIASKPNKLPKLHLVFSHCIIS